MHLQVVTSLFNTGALRLARAAIRGMHNAILYSAQHAAHGPLDWTMAEEMAKVTDAIKKLAGLWMVEDGSGVLRGRCLDLSQVKGRWIDLHLEKKEVERRGGGASASAPLPALS
jgi:hypothetical protein